MAFSFSQFIHALQHKDERSKQRWVLGGAFCFTAFLVVVWFFSSDALFPALRPAPAVAETKDASSSEDSFFETFSRGFAKIKQDTATQFSRVKDQFSTLEERLSSRNTISVTPSTTPSTISQ